MSDTSTTLIVGAACILLGVTLTVLFIGWRKRVEANKSLPKLVPLAARLILNRHEVDFLGRLQAAVPQGMIAVKPQLTRFMRLTSGAKGEENYWFEMLKSMSVSFAVCTKNGMVIAAIDLVSPRNVQLDARAIKRRLLEAANILYLTVDQNMQPNTQWLQQIVLGAEHAHLAESSNAYRNMLGGQSLESVEAARAKLEQLLQSRRDDREVAFRESMFKDSFLQPDSRMDVTHG